MELAPNDVCILNNLAVLLTHEGQNQEAESLYKVQLCVCVCMCVCVRAYVCFLRACVCVF